MLRLLSTAAAAAAFLLAVLGSWVRVTGAGLTCPDWPLCRGALVPALNDAVVWEWGHRFVAVVLAALLAATLWAAWQRRNHIAFVRPLVASIAAGFVVQVLLGAATVRLANSPSSVVLHWATAMLFLAALVALATVAALEPPPGTRLATSPFHGALALTAVLAFVTMSLGAYVSSSGAGLVCRTFPDCNGSLLGTTTPETVQMVHRFAAAALFVTAIVVTYWSIAAAAARVRAVALAMFALLVFQAMLGMANVAWKLPVILREAHAANAAAVFIAAVCALCLALFESDPLPAYSSAAAARSLEPATAPSQ